MRRRSPFRSRSLLALAGVAAALAGPAHAQEVEALRAALTSELEGRGWGNAIWGVVVKSLDGGDTLLDVNGDSALAPASNIKLLTSAAALHVLGPEYRFRTWVLTDDVVRDGVVHGDVVLYGTGDPGISDRFYRRRDAVFQLLIDQLAEAGIHTITGDVVADASFFPGPLRDESWDRRDLNEHFTAGVSSISYNENVVSFRIVATGAGAPPRVETVPGHSGLEVDNTARMVTRPARPRLAILRDDPLEPVRVVGRMVVGSRDVWRQMTVAVPARFAAESFHAALVDRGITVVGGTKVVELPGRSVVGRVSAPARGRRGARILATHAGRPLPEYLALINKQSNNLYAELVFRAIGRAARGVGSPEVASAVVRETLHDIGVDTTGLLQRDGSGLSGANRVSARAFVQTIDGMSRGALWPEYWASLPEAGSRRELRRMYRTAAAGNLRAKTGTIERVSALSGMVRSADGERLAFSILVNDSPSEARAKSTENRIGARLAEFRRGSGRLPTIVTESLPSRPRTGGDRHRIAPGENLSTIAQQYGYSLAELMQVNPRLEPNRIMAGDWIDLPRQLSGGSEP